MADNKTQKTRSSVKKFIDSVENETRRNDALQLFEIMEEVTDCEPAMWGSSIVGYGNYRLKYESGREMDWFYVGFSARKHYMSVYLMDGFKKYDALLQKLGKHKTGKSCLNINRLVDVDLDVLKSMLSESVAYQKVKHAES